MEKNKGREEGVGVKGGGLIVKTFFLGKGGLLERGGLILREGGLIEDLRYSYYCFFFPLRCQKKALTLL